MKNCIVILGLTLFAAVCVGASESYPDPVLFEGRVYAFHNPNDSARLNWQSAVHSKKLILQMFRDEFASNRIELDGNFLSIDRRPIIAALSLAVAGGCPKKEHLYGTDKEGCVYFSPLRFFVLQKYIGFWHTCDPNKELQKSVQKYASLVEVMEHLRATSEPAIVIDLNAWLDVAFGEHRKYLPVIRIPQEQRRIQSDHFNLEPLDLTQEQYEEHLAKKQSSSIEHTLSSLHLN